ncbi:sodium:solute symporter family protein [Algisphaera agarilytica]|uniref:Na+/proline symporter n=1 Tax=Algisphaera agarilytica TaxID=1385975 RepID=A0A7X0H8I1_9BACT|nr:hypothetical protein [Algisphaera agarilytica]MBB6431239.1 Na+/proline symporter [Algisphaera agarilytica]
MQTVDWIIIAAFGLLLVGIVIFTNRITKSVAGFLSSERCAGRYLLTIANSMAFCSAIGIVGGFEGTYRNGITSIWWGMLMMPIGTILALTGWVTYRYRQTRSLTMAQFLEKRYSRKFRIFAGFVAFISGMLNCAVFPLVTAHFLVYFLDLPQVTYFTLGPWECGTHFLVMLVMVSLGVILAISGGQITIMVTDFFQGTIGTVALLAMIALLLSTVGWSTLMTTLKASEDIRVLETTGGDQLEYPVWYQERVAPVREHHAALEAAMPGVFEVLRDNPEVFDALGQGVEEARVLAAEKRELDLVGLELAAADYEEDADLAKALETGVAEAKAVALDNANALLADDDAENDSKAEALLTLANGSAVLTQAARSYRSTRLLVNEDYPDMVRILERAEDASMMNPSKLGNEGAFSVPFFIMMGLIMISQVGVWQGGSGYLTAARTPHEGRMGGILSGWRWMTITLGSVAAVTLIYCTIWNANYVQEQQAIQEAAQAIQDPLLQSQQFVPTALGIVLPAGLMGLFAVFMIGASISTDDSAYHSWGSIFLQDVVMPFRKKPFSTKEHLLYLRLAIIGVGLFALFFSSLWRLTDFINMWFQITGAIYTGGAMCAIVGGLYWRRGTTAGAWAGMLVGSSLSLYAIYFLNGRNLVAEGINLFGLIHLELKNIPILSVVQSTEVPYKVPRWIIGVGGEPINGLHLAVMNILISIGVYTLVSTLTCRVPTNLDKLLHRGEYAIDDDKTAAAKEAEKSGKRRNILRMIGITDEFSKFDVFLYCLSITWTAMLSISFLSITTWFLFFQSAEERNNSAEAWYTGWAWLLGIQGLMAVITGIWYACGGARDLVRLVRAVQGKAVDEADDGFEQTKPAFEKE